MCIFAAAGAGGSHTVPAYAASNWLQAGSSAVSFASGRTRAQECEAEAFLLSLSSSVGAFAHTGRVLSRAARAAALAAAAWAALAAEVLTLSGCASSGATCEYTSS